MYQRMLVLLDGSELAEVVFSYAKEIAARLSLDVMLLHVYGQAGKQFVPMHRAYIDRAASKIRREAKEIQKALGTFESSPVKVTGDLVMGYHADEILKYVDEHCIDFIMMASHGRSGIKRWGMGSVADKILRATKVPVWLVKTGIENVVPYDEWPTKTILVPLSSSPTSETVLPHVLKLSKQQGQEPIKVILFRVCDLPVAPTYYSPELSGIPLNWGEYVEQETARSKQAAIDYLLEKEQLFKDAGIPVESRILVGKAAEEIVDYSNKNPYTLIVMATHGRTGFSRLVYGSIAESVLLGVSNPIFLVRPQKSENTVNNTEG